MSASAIYRRFEVSYSHSGLANTRPTTPSYIFRSVGDGVADWRSFMHHVRECLQRRTLRSSVRLGLVAMILALVSASIARAQRADDYLARGFQQPPDSAKPRVWWHWMNGNVTKAGIKADLEWMNRVGIGGFQNFDASLGTPQIVQKRLIYMTPEWKDAFRYATTLADQLGLEEGVASSAGWNLSGGSWVLPAHAMKKFVWSETEINGGEAFHGALKRPPSNAGPFQNIPSNRTAPDFYADSAVFAYRLPANDPPPHDQPKITSSGGQFDLSTLIDGDLTNATLLPAAPPNESSWIQFEYSKPQRICGVSIAFVFKSGEEHRVMAQTRVAVEASEDGQGFSFRRGRSLGISTISGAHGCISCNHREVLSGHFQNPSAKRPPQSERAYLNLPSIPTCPSIDSKQKRRSGEKATYSMWQRRPPLLETRSGNPT